MSQKKFRPSSAPGKGAAALNGGSPAAAVGAKRPAAAVIPASSRPTERFWLEVAVFRMSRWLGSLQIAVILLSVFAFVLAIGTMVESWYSDKVAKDLVYRTWWFNLLLLLLGVNIFFAAAKKWPWKKYQTGFLITHVGLLTLVAGGLLTGLGGTDTTMTLVATSDSNEQARVGAPQADHFVVDRETAVIRIRDFKGGKEQTRDFVIRTGSLPWRGDEHFQPNLYPLLAILDFLDHPLPRTWHAELDQDDWLEVLNYYPHVRRESFRPAEPGEADTFPAVKIALSSSLPMMRQVNPERWVAGNIRSATSSIEGIAAVQMLGKCPSAMLQEFLKPPPAEEKGQLVFHVGGVTQRFAVASALGQPAQEISGTGWKVQITRMEASLPKDEVHGKSSMPLLEFTVTSPDGQKNRYGILAQLPGEVIRLDESRSRGSRENERWQAWLHPADPRIDQTNARSLLQFVTGADGKLYYRAYSSVSGKFALDKSAEANVDGAQVSIWAAAADWKFQVLEYLPLAVADTWYLPEERRPGLEDAEQKLRPALRCRMHVGKETKDFWLVRSESAATRVSCGGKQFSIGFNDNRSDLGFEVKLLRAETLLDPGASSKAGYTSWVKVTDAERKVQEDRLITMNQPMEYLGYKFFQSGLDSAGWDQSTLKPISYSVFTVSRDPGLWLKYVGSTMLALGITCMFYMKAYFFRPRRPKAPAVDLVTKAAEQGI